MFFLKIHIDVKVEKKDYNFVEINRKCNCHEKGFNIIIRNSLFVFIC